MKSPTEQIENFERAFGSRSSGCRRTCKCGREFYDTDNSYDWEDGELEALGKDKKATGVPYSVGSLILEGKEYCCDCDCWHERAKSIIRWLEDHGDGVAEWLTLEKKRKQREADNSPVVKSS